MENKLRLYRSLSSEEQSFYLSSNLRFIQKKLNSNYDTKKTLNSIPRKPNFTLTTRYATNLHII